METYRYDISGRSLFSPVAAVFLISFLCLQCVGSSLKGPIAVFNPAMGSEPPTLHVYETLQHKDESVPILEHSGVSLHLLDHLLVTALFLVTDIQYWRTIDKQSRVRTSNDRPASPPPNFNPRRRSSHNHDAASVADASSHHNTSAFDLSASGCVQQNLSRSFLQMDSRSPSPSEEPQFVTSCSSGCAHAHLDPSFYTRDAPPVPQIPAQYLSQTYMSSCSRPFRELPIIPPLQPLRIQRRGQFPVLLTRSRSTPTQSNSTPSPLSSSSFSPSLTSFGSRGVYSNSNATTVSLSSSSSSSPLGTGKRRLPQPPTPQSKSEPQPPLLSVSITVGGKRDSKYNRRSLPPPPPTPLEESSPSASRADLRARSRTLEKELADLSDWLHLLAGHRHPLSAGNAVFDLPPPSYTSLNFAGPIGR